MYFNSVANFDTSAAPVTQTLVWVLARNLDVDLEEDGGGSDRS